LNAINGDWQVTADAGGNSFTAVPKIGADYSSSFPVTVEKRDSSGNAVWATTLKGDANSSCPMLALMLGVTDDGRVGVALPNCPPGTPPGNAWNVMLLDSGGAASSRFTTGIGTVLAINRFGEVYAATADVGATIPSPDPKGGWPNGSPFLMRLIRPDGTDAWVDRAGTIGQLGDPHPTSDGGAVALGGYAPPDNVNPTVVRIDRSGKVLWTTEFPGSTYGSGGLAVLLTGEVTVPVARSGVIQYGDGQVGAAGQQETRAVLVIKADGTPRSVVPLPPPSSQAAYATLIPTALLDGGFTVSEGDATCPHVWAFSADFSPRWDRSVDASCTASITSAAATVDNLLLTGRSGATDFLNGKSLDSAGVYLLSIEP
jgi:hypothetical protein